MAIFPQGLTQIDRRCANAGERNTLQQLKRCLSDDYMVWHDVPIGPKARQPDFVILSPRRGLLILEVKHWAWGTIQNRRITKDSVELLTDTGLVTAAHPLRQARDYALELNDVLQSDPALVYDQAPFKGKSQVPYGWGCVLSNIRQKQTEGSDFEQVFPAYKTLLREDLDDAVDPYEFEKRLWGMFTLTFPYALSLPQRDRVRWHLFPEIRMPGGQTALDFQAQGQPLVLPDLMQVMDLTQEQVARTLGEGHRVIHGAAGSGKTMILIFRAQQLAAAARADQPVLVLCYNRPLAQRIDAMLRDRGVDERVVVRTFHAWCKDMVRTYQLDQPAARPNTDAYFAELANIVQRALDTGLVPGGQYTALLIDEAHDFQDAWLQMSVKLVAPATHSLLVLYDDAQSIYQQKRRKFNFASVGIEARGRTSILRLNYRNTAEVLALAMQCAQGLLTEKAPTEDEIQTVHPTSAGRRGPLPVLLGAPNARAEATLIAQRIADAVADGTAPGDIAVLCRIKKHMDVIEQAILKQRIPCHSMNSPGHRAFDWTQPKVKLLTLHSAKGLEFPMVFIAGLDAMPFMNESLEDEVRLLYVGMTRATQRLLLCSAGTSPIVQRVKNSLEAVAAQFAAAP
ncbi:3'-5' exonuclease [Rhodoferax sp.]|uniref:3'-5' exonuclease n=1 Tax=Rhodoferax sp. TaxID=50421 RepID=UPI002754D717|nr:3'-5' exonuclease [Rhodoferax sp.]